MKREENIKSYTTTELKAKRGESRTDLSKVDAITDDALERFVAEDEDERSLHAALVVVLGNEPFQCFIRDGINPAQIGAAFSPFGLKFRCRIALDIFVFLHGAPSERK